MRSVYLDQEIDAGLEKIMVIDDKFHHLKVVRAKIGEEILVLNGKAMKALCKIETIDKKHIELSVVNIEKCKEYEPEITIFLACPKKEAFEDCIRMATELGVKSVTPVLSRFSQYENSHFKRVDKIIESAIEQSNNPLFLNVHKPQKMEDALIMAKELDYNFAFSSYSGVSSIPITITKGSKVGIWIGPEAGFSSEEEAELTTISNAMINLNVPIMRTPTALCVALGHVHAFVKRN